MVANQDARSAGTPPTPSWHSLESHGCAHLPSEYARLLFDAAPKGMTVVISKAGLAPDDILHPPFLDPLNTSGQEAENLTLSASEAYRWVPDKSPDGPRSILISRVDERIIVLRNGIEIGRAKVVFRDTGKSLGSHVFVSKSTESNSTLLKQQWFGVAVDGHMGDAGSVAVPGSRWPYRD